MNNQQLYYQRLSFTSFAQLLAKYMLEFVLIAEEFGTIHGIEKDEVLRLKHDIYEIYEKLATLKVNI